MDGDRIGSNCVVLEANVLPIAAAAHMSLNLALGCVGGEETDCLWWEACYFGLTSLVNVVKLLALPTRGVVFLPMLLGFGWLAFGS